MRRSMLFMPVLRTAAAAVLFFPACGFAQTNDPPRRVILPGIATSRPVHGAPYELRGNRVVFLNWYYVQPGDLDWRDAAGKSVYVSGDSGLFEAAHVGIRAPRGIRIRAQKPVVQGPLFRPHRMILRDGNVFRGWTDSDYYESPDGMHWEKKSHLGLDEPIKDGLFQVFVDPSSPVEERFKAVWVGEINRARSAPDVSHDLERFDRRYDADCDGFQPRRRTLALGPGRRPAEHTVVREMGRRLHLGHA
jgi:hypothetical protein